MRLLTERGPPGVRRDPCRAYEIERRPRGASLASQLPHLFRASYACAAAAVRLVGTTRFQRGHHRRPTCLMARAKADSDNLTGLIGPKQMWELACQRCAARAALDLIGAESFAANTPSFAYFGLERPVISRAISLA